MSAARRHPGPPVTLTPEERERAEGLRLLLSNESPPRDLDDALLRLRAWQRALDGFYQAWRERGSGAGVQCARGCAACCTQMVFDVHPLEVEALGRWVRESGRAAEFVEALARRVEAYARTRVETQRRLGEHVDDREERVAVAFHALRLPCVFLGDDGACTVHSIRPQACRRFFSLSDPTFCVAEHAGQPEHAAFFMEPVPEVDEALRAWDALAPFEPETDRLDEALLRWLRDRSAT